MNTKVVVSTMSVAALMSGAFIWFGLFNVSATEKHWVLTTKVLDLVRERSVYVRAKDIEVPSLDSQELVEKGAKNYSAMCAQCHLAPNMKPTELHLGLYPSPPTFYSPDHSIHDPSSAFWTIKNGLKLTGMPAWGAFHSAQEIWELVAFISDLKGMGPQKFQTLVGDGGHSHSGENMHENSLTGH